MLAEIIKELDRWDVNQLQIEPLTGGLSNENYLLSPRNSQQRYVLKMPPQLTSPCNRQYEIEVYHKCAQQGIAPPLEWISKTGAFLSRHIEGNVLDVGQLQASPELMHQCMDLVRNMHQTIEVDFEMSYESIMYMFPDFDAEYMYEQVSDYNTMIDVVQELIPLLNTNDAQLVSCHNDLILNNFIEDNNRRLWLIDFEWSGLNDLYYDLSKFSIFAQLADEQILKAYFGQCNAWQLARMYLFKMINHYLVAQWCSTQLRESVLEVDETLQAIGKSNLNAFMNAYRCRRFMDCWNLMI